MRCWSVSSAWLWSTHRTPTTTAWLLFRAPSEWDLNCCLWFATRKWKSLSFLVVSDLNEWKEYELWRRGERKKQLGSKKLQLVTKWGLKSGKSEGEWGEIYEVRSNGCQLEGDKALWRCENKDDKGYVLQQGPRRMRRQKFKRRHVEKKLYVIWY